MKIIFLSLASIILFISCSKVEILDENIGRTENNLIPPVYVMGDSTWSIEERMKHYDIPGVSLAVIQDYQIAWYKTYGIQNKVDKNIVVENTLFQAASISKPVTAMAALKLVEEGKIDLEANINSQLKSWQIQENEFTIDQKVTLKNLLNHSAGTTVHGFWGYSPDLPIPTLIEVLNGESPANSDPIFVDKKPQESFRYSGGGYNVIQQLLIDVKNKPFPELMDELLLKPLGMLNSSFEQPLNNDLLKLASTGYLSDGSMTKGQRHIYPEMAAAGLWTTAEDLAKFTVTIQKTLKNKSQTILSEEMTRNMLTPFVEEFIGLGMFLDKKKEQVYFGHGGWNEGFSSDMVAHIENGYGVVVMINCNQPDFIGELIRSVALTYKWQDYIKEYTVHKSSNSIDERVLGKYSVRGFDIIKIASINGELLYQYGAEGEFVPFTRISDSSFVIRELDVVYRFKFDEEKDTISLQMLNSSTFDIESEYMKVTSDVLAPIELLCNGNYKKALESYLTIQKKDKSDAAINENNLNFLGYRYLSNGKKKLAKDLFKIIIALYPDSYNAYDSYAEACMELNDYKLALENYEKSLELNPDNENAKEQIEKMKALKKE